MAPAKPKRMTRAALEAELAGIGDTLAAALREKDEQHKVELQRVRDQLTIAQGKLRDTTEREEKTRAQFDDLKTRLAGAQDQVREMRGYIARVQEDDVVREELIATGDPAGQQQLVPKRKPRLFDGLPDPTDFSSRGTATGYADRYREPPQPKHWVTY